MAKSPARRAYALQQDRSSSALTWAVADGEVFAAGNRRIIVFGSLLGVHSIVSIPKDRTERVEDDSAMAETVRLVRVMKSYGTPEAVIAKLVSTPSSEITWLDAKDTAGWVEIVNTYGDPVSTYESPASSGSGQRPTAATLSGNIGQWTIKQGKFGDGAACGASRSYSNGTVLAFYVTPDNRSWLFLANEAWGWQGNTRARLDFVDEGIEWSGTSIAFADGTGMAIPLDHASAKKLMDAETMTVTVGGARATPSLALNDSRAAGKAATACARKL